MKAMMQDRYGSSGVLRLDEVATPAPGADEVSVFDDRALQVIPRYLRALEAAAVARRRHSGE